MLSSTFILPAAGFGEIKKNSGTPILLTQFADGQFLYEKQINAIRTVYPNARIIYVTGWHHEKVDDKLLRLRCEVINNLSFENKSIPYSVSLAYKLCNMIGAFHLIYGNLYFTEHTLNKFKLYGKIIPTPNVIGLNKENHKKSIGLGSNGQFDFVFDDKWARIAYIQNGSLFSSFAESTPYKLTHEILCNLMKWPWQSVHLNNMVVEINKNKDIKYINSLLKK